MSDEIYALSAGDVLEHTGKRHVLVLTVDADGKAGMFYSLASPKGSPRAANRMFRATLFEMAGWSPVYLEGPRLVEARHVDGDSVAWSTYLPDFASACDLARDVYSQHPRLFDLVIHAQHLDEFVYLANMGL